MIFDAIILAAVILSAVIAALRGFIRECLTIVGVVGGLAAAIVGGPKLQPLMHSWFGVRAGEDTPKLFDLISMEIVADVCAYGSIFVVVVIVLTVCSHLLASGVKAMGLGPVDRLLGVAFGIGRAILLMALLYLPVFLLVTEKERDGWFTGSYTRPYIEKTSSWIAGYLPKNTEKNVDNIADDATKKLDAMSRRIDDLDMLKNTADRANAALDAARGTLNDKAKPAPVESGEGYKPDQREGLDALIEDAQTPPQPAQQ